MSLSIEIDDVVAVLLADGWHQVERFGLDSYEFNDGDSDVVLRGGACAGVPATGAQWIETVDATSIVVSCPLTSVLAVRRTTASVEKRSADEDEDY